LPGWFEGSGTASLFGHVGGRYAFRMPAGIGPLELAIVLVIVLLVFGPKRLPGLGRQLGSGMREFKDSISGKSKDEPEHDERDDADRSAPALPPATPEEPRAERTADPGATDSERVEKEVFGGRGS
jgi:sec-independent protein translocase protein TatA